MINSPETRTTMKLTRLFITFLVFGVAACGFIQKVPSTSYTEMSEEEKERIQHPPYSSFSFSEKEYEGPEDVELYEIDEEGLLALMDSSINTWIYLWATDCPYYLMNLKEQELHKQDSARPNLQLFLISANYDPPIIKEYVYRSGYRKPVFVIDAEQYGKNMTQRMNAFAEAIAPGSLDSIKSMPQHFLFEGKKWSAHLSGTMSSPNALSDTLDHYFE